MQHDIEVRAAKLVAARRRIVEAADVERRGLVDAIHEGAESRLRAADAALARLGQPTLGPQDPLVVRIRAELNAAVDELHALAQGIRPVTLTAGGLAAAVPELGAQAEHLVTTHVTVGRLPAPEEAAVYFACAEGLANTAKHAGASRSWIHIHEEAGVVTAEIGDDGVGGADRYGSGIQGLIDRVQAVGGTLDIAEHTPHGTRLTLLLPRSPDVFDESGRAAR
jgi:signal transduction histidine kinase